MSNDATQVERFVKSRNVQKTIRLDQIVTDEQRFCHRKDDRLKPDKLKALAESLAQEGQQTPMVVIEQEGQFLLIAGHRRYFALQKAITDNLKGCKADMEISVTVVVQGDDQSDSEFELDVLIRSVSDNENRVQFDDNEKVAIAKLFAEQEIPVKRGMAALGVKETQYRRYINIAQTPWLYEAVRSGQIKSTNAAKLVEIAKQCDEATDRTEVENAAVDRMGLFKSGFDAWVAEAKQERDKDNRWRAANKKKPLEGKQAHLSRYFSTARLLHWEKCLKKGESFESDQPEEFAFLVKVDAKKLTLEIPKVSLKSDDIDEETLESIIGGLEEGLIAVSELLVQVERKRPVSESEAQEALARVRAKRAGNEADDFHEVEPVQTTNVEAAIQKRRSRKEDASKQGEKE